MALADSMQPGCTCCEPPPPPDCYFCDSDTAPTSIEITLDGFGTWELLPTLVDLPYPEGSGACIFNTSHLGDLPGVFLSVIWDSGVGNSNVYFTTDALTGATYSTTIGYSGNCEDGFELDLDSDGTGLGLPPTVTVIYNY